MSLLLDLKYMSFISNRLERVKKVSSTTWNSKCPWCSGSTSAPRKLTFYAYLKDGKLLTYCHVCTKSLNMYGFLQEFDQHLFTEYKKEYYIENNNGQKKQSVTKRKTYLDVITNKPSTIDYKEIIKDTPFISLLDLPDDHITKQYLKSRKIPESSYERLAYIPRMCDILKYWPDYENLEKSKEERLVIPFIDINKKLIGITCRALSNNKQRYIELKFDPDATMVFGMERIDLNATKICFEGFAECLFVGNSFSIAGMASIKIDALKIDKNTTILVPDRQPRHKQVVNNIKKFIDQNYRVCLLPDSFKGKDVNELIVNNEIEQKNILSLIENNSYQGLQAKLFFNTWKKC